VFGWTASNTGIAFMTNTIQVFVPVGSVLIAGAAGPATRAMPRSDFVVGLLDNHKHGSADILDRLQERLAAQFGAVRFVRFKKSDAGVSAGNKIIDDLAEECGVVLNGVAD
jgi:hypothetical protein